YGFDRFVASARGGKRGDSFWDVYSDIEAAARDFAIQGCMRKAASFTVEELADYIDTKYREIHGLPKDGSGYIRSVKSCRLDLERWGITHSANKSRPYFVGHERSDVIEHRNTIVDSFLSRELPLLPFKKEFENHKFEVLVDNATTHTTKLYSVHDFRKGEGFRCPIDFIEWQDENEQPQRLSCYYDQNIKGGCSKGLLVLAKELGLN
ncbi:unnamed protein product, partial [Didymodactylos carnosus]